MTAARADERPVRIVRIIARLNVGGPAIQAVTLSRRLEYRGYHTVLVRGREEPDEGNMNYLAEEHGVQPVLMPWLRRNPGWRDVPALLSLVRVLRRERPHIVHTHAAKGGTLGRAAALIAFPRKRARPILIHTYHGHSLTGYFSPRTAAIYRSIERFLARHTDRLIAVSGEVRDELVALGIAQTSKFDVVPLGFDLSPFTVNGTARKQLREALRAELGIPVDARVVTLIARLVPIKRVDRFLRVASALRELPDVHFMVVGDGELRDQLRASPEAQALGDRLIWAGFRQDMPAVCFASDVVLQTSDNEGTPVSLIEAQAAGIPAISTAVGGTASVVDPDRLAPAEDVQGLSDRVRGFVLDSDRARRSCAAAAVSMQERFSLERLVDDLDRVYRVELAGRQYSRRRHAAGAAGTAAP